MVYQWSDVLQPFTSYTKCLCYEEILMNLVPKQQTPLAVGSDELLKQDNPGRVVRLGGGVLLSSVYCTAQPEGMAPNDCEALILVKKQVSGLLGKSLYKTSEGGFRCTSIVALVGKGVRQP